MKKLLFAVVAIGIVGIHAVPAVAAPANTWSAPTFAAHLNNAGLVAGGQIGYNYQLTPWFVAGIETDLNYNGIRPTDTGATAFTGGGTGTHSLTQQFDWFGTFRGRVGVTPASEWLVYLTGGLAYGNVSSSTTLGPVQCCLSEVYGGSIDATRLFGWTAGAGVERRLGAGWSVKAEYLFVDLGSLSYTDSCITARPLQSDVCSGVAPPPTYTTTLATREHMVRMGLNYHLDPASLDHAEPLHPTPHNDPISRLYGGAEYLLWWVKGAPLSVPLVSSGPIDTTHHGWLINSDSTILYGAPFAPAQGGNDTQNFAGFSGTRLTLGYRLNDAQNFGLEVSGFALQTRTAGYQGRSDQSGEPVLNIPLYNVIPYSPGGRPGGLPPGEDGLPASLPLDPTRTDGNMGVFTGAITIVNKLQLWGADVGAVARLYRGNALELSGLAGVRYLNLAESFNLTYESVGVSGVYVGQNGAAYDQFATRNQFIGPSLGLRGRYTWGPVSAELTARAAVGLSHEVLTISGSYWVQNYLGSYRSGPEGVFAQPANEGSYSSNRLGLVPEVQLKLGYNVTRCSRRLTFTFRG